MIEVTPVAADTSFCVMCSVYDLRHAAVSTWLSAGVDSTQVAACAGHSVAVPMRVYASSLHGHQVQAMRQIEALVEVSEDADE